MGGGGGKMVTVTNGKWKRKLGRKLLIVVGFVRRLELQIQWGERGGIKIAAETKKKEVIFYYQRGLCVLVRMSFSRYPYPSIILNIELSIRVVD
jgi:hypothetical protein